MGGFFYVFLFQVSGFKFQVSSLFRFAPSVRPEVSGLESGFFNIRFAIVQFYTTALSILL
jgi:hypothetical protein